MEYRPDMISYGTNAVRSIRHHGGLYSLKIMGNKVSKAFITRAKIQTKKEKSYLLFQCPVEFVWKQDSKKKTRYIQSRKSAVYCLPNMFANKQKQELKKANENLTIKLNKTKKSLTTQSIWIISRSLRQNIDQTRDQNNPMKKLKIISGLYGRVIIWDIAQNIVFGPFFEWRFWGKVAIKSKIFR